MSDIKFSDTNVRTYPQLTEIAVEYAADYAGDWEFMVAARSLALQSGTLPTATARAVLNAMRADPKVVMSLPELYDLEPTPKHLRVDRTEHAVEVTRWPFNVEIKWNLDYYCATHKQATAAHLLNHERSHLRYYPMFGRPNYSIREQYEFNLIAECGVRLRTGHLFETDLERYTCRSCLSLRDERHIERLREASAKELK